MRLFHAGPGQENPQACNRSPNVPHDRLAWNGPVLALIATSGHEDMAVGQWVVMAAPTAIPRYAPGSEREMELNLAMPISRPQDFRRENINGDRC